MNGTNLKNMNKLEYKSQQDILYLQRQSSNHLQGMKAITSCKTRATSSYRL